MLWKSLATNDASPTLANYVSVFSGKHAEALWNSIVFGVATAALSLAIGALLAWSSERADGWSRWLYRVVPLLPLVVPGILFTPAWAILASPNAGLLNRLLGSPGTFNIYSMAGMVWVAGLYLAPIAFLLAPAAFRSANPSRTFAWLVLLLLALAVGSVEVPLLLGLPARVPLLASDLSQTLGYPVDFGLAASFGVTLLLFGWLGLSAGERVTAANGIGRRAGNGGRVGYAVPGVLYLLVAGLLPVFALVWLSLAPFGIGAFSFDAYSTVLQDVAIGWAAIITATLAAGTATVVTVFGWAVGSSASGAGARWRRLLNSVLKLPLVLSGVVMGLAVMLCYFGSLDGTIAVLVIAYAGRFLSYGIHNATDGKGTPTAVADLRGIFLPIWTPGLAGAWLAIVIAAIGEFPVAFILGRPNAHVLSFHIFSLWEDGSTDIVAALGTIMIAVLLGLTLLAGFVTRRFDDEKV
jgi:iron(III) transport system permease protein